MANALSIRDADSSKPFEVGELMIASEPTTAFAETAHPKSGANR
jgi:hypothetical protein